MKINQKQKVNILFQFQPLNPPNAITQENMKKKQKNYEKQKKNKKREEKTRKK